MGGNLTQYEVNYHELNGNFMVGAHKKYGPSFSFDANIGGNSQDNVTTINGIGAVPNSPNRAAGPFIIAGNYNANNIVIKPYSTYNFHYRVNSLYASAEMGFKNISSSTSPPVTIGFPPLASIQTITCTPPSPAVFSSPMPGVFRPGSAWAN